MFSEKTKTKFRSLRSFKAILGFLAILWRPIEWLLGKIGDIDTAREHWPEVHKMLTEAGAFLQTGWGYLVTFVGGIGWLAYLVLRSDKPTPILAPAEREAQFLSALTALSRRQGIGIGTERELFVMEVGGERDDFNRVYKIDPQVGLLFD